MSDTAHTRSGVAREREMAFATILLENGWISEADLDIATDFAIREQLALVDAVVALRLLDEHESYAVLSIAAGVEFVDLSEAELSVLAIRLVPAALARERWVVPISVDNRVLSYATCCPFVSETKRELTLATGRQPRMMVAERSSVLSALDHCYPTSLEPIEPAITSGPANSIGMFSHSSPPLDWNRTAVQYDGNLGCQRILITDDEPVTRAVIKMLLQKQQFDVLEAVNGRDAIDLVGRFRPDLLLMDLNMPEMNGYQAIEHLRRDPTLLSMPIVVLTSEEGPAIEHRVLQLGANDYLVKPFDPEVLVSRVTAAVRRMPTLGIADIQR